MKKCPIGFSSGVEETQESLAPVTPQPEEKEVKKSIVEVFFPSTHRSFSYYNDSFNLKVGDFVYVEGSCAGTRGQVTEINYSFKIKLSDYKKVIAVVDTSVNGSFYFAGSHLVSFNRNTLPIEKAVSWFKAPSEESFVTGSDESKSFPLSNLMKMEASNKIIERGHEYYNTNKVVYICVDGSRGYAIVSGSDTYEVDFNFFEGQISDIRCSCFCSGICKHEFAAMLQLRETLEFVLNNYEKEYDDYFIAISKEEFMLTVLNKKGTGKISLSI